MIAALLAVLTLPAPPPATAAAFDLEATQRALGHPEGRDGALAALDRLPAPFRPGATAAGTGALLATVALDPSAALSHRVRAVRLVPYYVTPDAPVAPLLGPLLQATPDPEATALARETATALAALGPVGHPVLAPAAGHPDPELRATVGRAGALGAGTCALLEDPWPVVRQGAARGLPADAPCLAAAIADKDAKVALPAIARAGHSAQPAVGPALRKVAGDARGPMPLRVEAIIALGRRGDLEPAARILKTHHAKGGIVPLADAAVRALAAHGQPTDLPLLRQALAAPSARVQVTAAEALAQRGDHASEGDITRLYEKAAGPARRRLAAALERLRDAPPQLGDGGEDEAPEDD